MNDLPIDKIRLIPAMRTHIVESLCEAYAQQIDALTGKGPGYFTKKVAEDLKAGYRDGVLSALNTLTDTIEVPA